MNRKELIARAAQATGLAPGVMKLALAGALDVIGDAVREGETVQLVGFGSFNLAERAARAGRNPRTGDPIEVPAKLYVKFRPGIDLDGAPLKPK